MCRVGKNLSPIGAPTRFHVGNLGSYREVSRRGRATVFRVLHALLGGALIGAAATIYWVFNQRVAGVSGVVAGALRDRGDRRERLLFLAGLVAAGALATLVKGVPAPAGQAPAPLVLAGLLVGFGTRLGGGCTSGHGVCGLSRLQARSLVATATFFTAGVVTVLAVTRLAPGWGVP
jgi:uncharacterized membrane protein YedE/YeeE